MTLSGSQFGKQGSGDSGTMWLNHEENAEILAGVVKNAPSKMMRKHFSNLPPATTTKDQDLRHALASEQAPDDDAPERVDEASERASRTEPQNDCDDSKSISETINFSDSHHRADHNVTSTTEESKLRERHVNRQGDQSSKGSSRKTQKGRRNIQSSARKRKDESVVDDGSLTFVSTLHMMFSDDESIMLAERDGCVSAYDRVFACLFGFDVDEDGDFVAAQDIDVGFGETFNTLDDQKVVEPNSLSL